MARLKGSGRAHICYPEKHIAGIEKGGKCPQINNPHYEVDNQGEPTPADPRRRRNLRAGSMHLKGEK